NAQTDATILIVTHNINVARTVPDNLGMLYRRELVMFGPREVLLTSDEPAVRQFLNGQRHGPIGMSEEKDQATLAAEGAFSWTPSAAIVPQLQSSPGLPERRAVRRHRERLVGVVR
ncbi:MAG TPA: ABC transporter ATP-binding protein, partial [Actinophytocola sp.]|nr:ABC transporter ATP-binding protein [Actinophytocola sp.]